MAWNAWAKATAVLAAVACFVGMLSIGPWVWGLVLSTQGQNWYGLLDVPVVRTVLGAAFGFGILFGGVFAFIILPVLVGGFVYEGMKPKSSE